MKRATKFIQALNVKRAISIHALMKRATVTVSADAVSGDISIHALMKRATSPTSSSKSISADFNPRPHEEGDSRFIVYIITALCISIHALMKRATRLHNSIKHS